MSLTAVQGRLTAVAGGSVATHLAWGNVGSAGPPLGSPTRPGPSGTLTSQVRPQGRSGRMLARTRCLTMEWDIGRNAIQQYGTRLLHTGSTVQMFVYNLLHPQSRNAPKCFPCSRVFLLESGGNTSHTTPPAPTPVPRTRAGFTRTAPCRCGRAARVGTHPRQPRQLSGQAAPLGALPAGAG